MGEKRLDLTNGFFPPAWMASRMGRSRLEQNVWHWDYVKPYTTKQEAIIKEIQLSTKESRRLSYVDVKCWKCGDTQKKLLYDTSKVCWNCEWLEDQE